MRVQLVLYPQNYQGQYSSIATPNVSEFVADPVFSTGLDSVSTTTSSTPLADRLTNNPSVIGLWKGFSSSGGGGGWSAADAPISTLNQLTLDSGTGSQSVCGVYQTINNLIPGNDYDL